MFNAHTTKKNRLLSLLCDNPAQFEINKQKHDTPIKIILFRLIDCKIIFGY